MGAIRIKKAKIKDDHFLQVEFDEHLPNNVTNSIVRDSTAPVHQDLINNFKKLEPHFAFICEQISKEDFVAALQDPNEGLEDNGDDQPVRVTAVADDGTEADATDLFGNKVDEELPKPIMEKFLVTGFVLKRKGDSEAVMLIGRRYLDNGDIVNMNSPLMKVDEEDYKYSSELAEAVEACKFEILEFLVHDKVAPDRQQEIPFDGEEGEGDEGLIPVEGGDAHAEKNEEKDWFEADPEVAEKRTVRKKASEKKKEVAPAEVDDDLFE